MLFINKVPFIKLNLNPGVFVLDDTSATGKTYLANLMRKYSDNTSVLSVYSYGDYLKGLDIGYNVTKQTKVLFLDRYDMYYEYEHSEELANFANSGIIVLMDCKRVESYPEECGLATIKLSQEGIEVLV